MRPLKADLLDTTKRDPAPSRWGYRYQRLMLTPGFRKLLKVGLPMLVVGGLVAGWTAREANRQLVADAYNDIKTQIQQRDEFMVKVMAVDGADDTLAGDVRTVLMRQTVAALPAVADAALRVRPGGILQVNVTQRQPVAVFRAPEGLKLIDGEGVLIQNIMARADRSDLPLITGDGARDVLDEGLEIYRVAGPLRLRMRGLVRMGERRWDVILEGGQRVLLPTNGAVAAFERVVALDQAHDMLERDVAVVDMRHSARPTIRMNEQAVATLRQIAGEAEQ